MSDLLSTSKSYATDINHKNRINGLDTLRIFALALVTWQHAASLLGAYSDTQWHGISPGQTGVGVFCTISGYLAFRTTHSTSPNEWLKRRLHSIFPSYWLVTITAFMMVMIMGSNKPITIWLFISQMLGLGYFTHGWALVNVVSWFISLILLCYTLSFVAKRFSHSKAFWILIAILVAILVTTRTEVTLSRHILAFALGALYSSQQSKITFVPISFAMIALGISIDHQLFYAGFSLFLLGLAVNGKIAEPQLFHYAAKYSYEYYLIHGICLVATTKFIFNPIISVSSAIAASFIAAIALHYLSIYISSASPLIKVKANS